MTGKAIKETKGKLKMSYLVWDFVKEMIRVRHFGAEKYPDVWNWQKGREYSEYYDAAQRHINSWFFKRERLAKDSRLHHLAHAAINLMFLFWFEMTGRTELDDRGKGQVGDLSQVEIEPRVDDLHFD